MPRLKHDAPHEPSDVTDLASLSFQEKLAIGLDRLKSTRGLTNKELGEQLGVSEAYMSQVTRGMRDVKLTTLDKMTRVWGVSIEDLFTVTAEDLARIAAKKASRRKKKAAKPSS
ncbi:helix-turn-helix domain-containing protein [Rhizobium beringeri]|uniref:XRE family transcriptional regulator n=2 Tax=Rhizobium TaxID=379 RepID=A0A1L3ZI35_RHILE|nr:MULTISPECIES: helix-turn-helix transcriptional regulator [Rhizobium]NKL50667.1 helix-turn-helix domain-containing protein [Rhizobium leguminosarum bv. viciae]API55210.1 XRE family transcriptional regulator [Rhizobium leguminosarum]MBX4925818.1 helix-turn-helix transcriptional regulator [Rhizobium binae]MBX4996071.1 helix-turn-helix transcriptional regulator [Rhizobium binae]MBX5020481.1 helix-turn-helix transcriptional regulator [Rhizobium lentis]